MVGPPELRVMGPEKTQGSEDRRPCMCVAASGTPTLVALLASCPPCLPACPPSRTKCAGCAKKPNACCDGPPTALARACFSPSLASVTTRSPVFSSSHASHPPPQNTWRRNLASAWMQMQTSMGCSHRRRALPPITGVIEPGLPHPQSGGGGGMCERSSSIPTRCRPGRTAHAC
jgi:hypothetical protein